jgi:hypothetical protein
MWQHGPVLNASTRPLRPCGRLLLRCLLALAIAMPGAAYPIDLSHLLRLPLEELLRLKITASVQPLHRRGASATPPTPIDWSVA